MRTDARGDAAIMFAEVIGNARPLSHDAQRASVVVRELQTLLPPLITQWQGTLHTKVGDSALATFASPIDAIRCACAIQRRLRQASDIALRIGLHVGDVVVGHETVHGDGVDVVKRIEPMAPPGGIALSDAMRVRLPGEVDLPLRSIGHPMATSAGTPMEIFVCDGTALPEAHERPEMRIAALWRSVRRSAVARWTAGYIALAAGMLQGIALLADLFGAPPLVSRIAAILLAGGAPVVATIAWFHGSPGPQRLVPREVAMLIGWVALCGIVMTWQLTQERPAQSQIQEHPRASSARAARPAPTGNSVLVLPFESPGGPKEDAYLSEAFGDELRDQLSRVGGLSVIARHSSIALRDAGTDAQSIAAEWGVATVVEGTLRREGEQIRVTVRLVDAASGVQRWSDAYVGKVDDLLGVQQEIALAASREILPRLSLADMPKQQWQASVNELMLLARTYQQNAVGPRDQDRVIALYEEVLAEDPQLAVAHARLGRALMLQGRDPAAAEQHLRRALELDPALAEGHANLGFLLWSQFREGGGAMFQRAIELNPNDAQVLHQHFLYAVAQRREDARPYLLRARELDPMSLLINADLAWNRATNGNVSAAVAEMALIEQRFADANSRLALARIADTAGLVDESIAWALETLRLQPDRSDAVQHLAESYARLGLTEESRRALPGPTLRTLFWERRHEEIIARMERVDLDESDADALGFLAFALQALGRDSEAVPILEGLGLPEIALNDDLRRWPAIHHLATFIGSLQAVGNEVDAHRLASWLDDFSGRRTYADDGWGSWYWTACASAALGDHERAIAAFERSATAPNLAWRPLLHDAACFRGLREDARYRAALDALESRYVQLTRRLPETLARHGLPKSSD